MSTTEFVSVYPKPQAANVARPAIRNFFRPYLSEYEPASGCDIPIDRENPATSNPSSNPEAPKSLAKIGRNGTTNPTPIMDI